MSNVILHHYIYPLESLYIFLKGIEFYIKILNRIFPNIPREDMFLLSIEIVVNHFAFGYNYVSDSESWYHILSLSLVPGTEILKLLEFFK
jgi:hypothetical protein